VIEPFDIRNVATNQPWLMPADLVGVPSELMQLKYPHYILTTDGRIVEEPNFLRYAIFLERARHRIIRQTFLHQGHHYRYSSQKPPSKKHEVLVSTVFLGMDKNCLFESIIFGTWLDQDIWRSRTMEEALETHQFLIRLVHEHLGYLRRHPSLLKDWVRMRKFWKLAHKRGREWALKHAERMAMVDARLKRIPGDVHVPTGIFLDDLQAMVLPKQKPVKRPVNQPGTNLQVVTPIECAHCGEPILPGEPCAPIIGPRMHHECGFRLVGGSVGHQTGHCKCHGEEDTSEIGLTKREAAKASLAHFQESRASTGEMDALLPETLSGDDASGSSQESANPTTDISDAPATE
jgi:hypothetical protein